jgi:hypothetical protein
MGGLISDLLCCMKPFQPKEVNLYFFLAHFGCHDTLFVSPAAAQDVALPFEPMKKKVDRFSTCTCLECFFSIYSSWNVSSLSIIYGLLEVKGAMVQSLSTEKDWTR